MDSETIVPCVFFGCFAAVLCCIVVCVTVYNVSNPDCKCTAACCKAE